jgi:D-alanyl-D-alanine carboxypeptidase
MALLSVEARQGLRCGFLGLAAGGAALIITSDTAVARPHHIRYAHASREHHHARAEEYSPPASSILVDGNSGAILQASNPDALRHPASLTKVMTLYLLFERLDAGKIKLDTPLKVSEHASEQAPTKLELKPGQTIAVEDAIKGIVTKSANDAAVTVAENLGGDEETFAKLMTQKAHALGMTHTTYVNASGLPDDDQITSARDQALLGRAIQDRFPRYYKYFSTASFVYHGEAMRNHNHLLGAVDGVDGIKTGFTRASGFNLLTSLHRDGRYLVGVVMGGPSASERDAHMRELISDHFKEAALRRTTPVLAESEAQPVAFGKAPMTSTLTASRTEPASTATVNPHVAAAANDSIHPVAVKTISYRTAPMQTASLGPMPALLPNPMAAPQQAMPQPAAHPSPAASAEQPRNIAVASADPAADRVAVLRAAAATPERSTPESAKSDSAKPEVEKSDSARSESAKSDSTTAVPAMHEPAPPEPAAETARGSAKGEPVISSARVHAHGGWLIQIGAYEDEGEAKQHLGAAQSKVRDTLAAKDPFTERIQKGDKSFYRARFAGFDKTTAEAACKQLKRSDFECMALKD